MTIEALREHNLDRAVAHWMSHVKRDAEWSDADPDSASIAHDGASLINSGGRRSDSVVPHVAMGRSRLIHTAPTTAVRVSPQCESSAFRRNLVRSAADGLTQRSSCSPTEEKAAASSWREARRMGKKMSQGPHRSWDIFGTTRS